MKKQLTVGVLGTAVAFAFSGCIVSTDGGGPDDSFDAEPVRSVSQALLTPTLMTTWASNNTSGVASVTCPSGLPWALGAGATGNLNKVFYGSGPAPTTVKAQSTTNSDAAIVTCSDAFATYTTVFESDGSATATCPAWKVPVGGGGICENSSARLYRSRPSPDTNGSVPTGWTASCDSGGVETFVNCANKEATYDFRSCRTRRTDSAFDDVDVDCNPGELAVAVGGYCGGSGDLEVLNFDPDLEYVRVQCSANTVHGYAICCDANLD